MMRLYTKQTLFSALSTLVIILLFVLLLPRLMQQIASANTNRALRQQQAKVMKELRQKGMDYYLYGASEYGSYSMLKDEYISLEQIERPFPDALETGQRLIEQDTITYRILTHSFVANDQLYLLEIGKRIATINEEGRALQKTALYILLPLALLLLLIHLGYSRYLLRPLDFIIKNRLLGAHFPFRQQGPPLKTSTLDFRYLDRSIHTLMQQVHTAFEKEREFTANASHELLTPLSIFQSRIENLLTDTTLSSRQAAEMEGLLKSVYRVKKIINALLLIARVENEQYQRKDTIDPLSFVAELTEELEHRLNENQLQLRSEIRHPVPLRQVNRELLFQLFYNLIANAIKYNRPNGTIEILDGRNAAGLYFIAVKDTGIGIDPALEAHVFDRFKKSGQQGEQSNGLGLSIVRSIAVYHDIAIELDTVLHQGSCFRVVFPTAIAGPENER